MAKVAASKERREVWNTRTTGRLIAHPSFRDPIPGSGDGAQGGTLKLSHIRRLGLFFGVQNSEFQYFFGFSEK